MSTETINFTCKKHCYKVFCAKPHTARLPDNRKVVCILKSELLPLKNLSCMSSLQQQHHPAPRVPEQGVRVRASQLSFSSPEPSLTTSSKLQVPNLLVSTSSCPSETPRRAWNLLVQSCECYSEEQLSRNKMGDTALPEDRRISLPQCFLVFALTVHKSDLYMRAAAPASGALRPKLPQ